MIDEVETMGLRRWLWVVTVGCLVMGGCGHKRSARPVARVKQPALKAPPPTPLVEKKVELGAAVPWQPAWSVLVEQQLPATMLGTRAARAVHGWCPRFAVQTPAEKRAFWAYVLQAMAAAESGIAPRTVVHHTEAAVDVTDSVTRRPVRQEGLLQLTYQDSARYGCAFDWERDRRLPARDPARTILDPERNLSCGLRILENQIVTQGRPLVSRASYWSTLQPGTRSYRVFAKQMANVPEACGLRARAAARRSRR